MNDRLNTDVIPEIQIEELEFFDGSLAEKIIKLVSCGISFSDIFIHQDSPLMVKRPSGIYRVSGEPIASNDIKGFFSQLDSEWEQILLEKNRAFDRAKLLNSVRVRANCFTFEGRKKFGSVIRVFPLAPPALETLGLRQHAMEFTKLRNGLVLLMGDTCQGKSTTLAAMLDRINAERSGHILTFEDPIEIPIPMRRSLITQREVGENGDVESFYLGAMDALRERPDVVLIGEIRDAETAKECVALAEAGPLVFASIHAKTPELGLWKMLRLLGGTDQTAGALSQVLKGVLYQTLLTDPQNETYHLATETITVDKVISELIARREFGNIRTHLKTSPGCNTLNEDLNALTNAGKIKYEDAERVTTDRENFDLEVGRG